MKISYAIPVCNELVELQRLLEFLIKNKREEDEIVILYDSENGSKNVEEFLRAKSVNDPQFVWYSNPLNKDFAQQKNYLTKMCTGDWVFLIDADEYPNKVLLQQLKPILEINDVDLIWIPRVNTIDGMTQEDVQRWGWRVTEKGWVNYPDYQARVFRNDKSIRWTRPLHEYITGCKTYSHLPPHEELSLYHPKTIQKQTEQNMFYNQNFSKEMNVRKM